MLRHKEDAALFSELCRLALHGLAMQWRPIETAPHDKKILLWCPDHGGPRTGWWTNEPLDPSFAPTHWMPLPEAPR